MENYEVLDEDWPKWLKGASRGDLISLAVHQRAVTVKLASAVLNLLKDDQEAARQACEEFFEDDERLGRLVDKLGKED